ncbi:MAG: potassium transporter Kup [Acidimicrobiia bacterium]|nr:potassium transporter Kup [Acidimicrobiia bacterium]MDH5519715.1 potassium transporter Kup [Acidimicrobiia bacterium]
MGRESDTSASVGVSAATLGALGVVFGDIGTSPLYALRESLAGEGGGTRVPIETSSVLGVLSLMIWALLLVITVKYVLIVMRADNDGEGGILALASLVEGQGRHSRELILLGLFGTALLYGDGMITPAISVLAAVEGLEVVSPTFNSAVTPVAIVILVGLFMIQHRGTETIGRFFGPVMAVWFGVLASLGLTAMIGNPSVLRALNPLYAMWFIVDNGMTGFLVLGSVFLVVTGGEALYADMGHFGIGPIRLGWFAVVLPSLMINYLGQGALLLDQPGAIENPFFLLAPTWAHLPLTILATAATIIASQALITGAFSLTVQAVNLDYLPRLHTRQTSAHNVGHVYVPSVNWMLLAACIILVLTFGSSSALAAAYGVAVTLTMVITTMLVFVVARHRWKWGLVRSIAVFAPLLAVDLAFAVANGAKIPSGGWVPLALGLIGFLIFTTWRTGRSLVGQRIERRAVSVADFVGGLADDPPIRHPGTGVYLHREAGVIPPALLANLRHNAALHESVVLLSLITDRQARVPKARRARLTQHDLGFAEVELHYGFFDLPDVSKDLNELLIEGLTFDVDHTSYFLGRERIEVTAEPGMAMWREHIFAFLHRNAGDPSSHFGLPAGHSVDIGTHVDL